MNSPNEKYQLLGGRLNMLSADGGYRAAIDPVLLAAAVPAKAKQNVLDVGCGTGAASLCLATRVLDINIHGIDQQAPLIELADVIAEINGLDSQAKFICGNILEVQDHIKSASYDHVMANPPHHKRGSGNPSPDPLKAAANVEGDATLADWVSFCFEKVKSGGSVTFVHRYDRVDELVSLMETGGAVSVFPLWPKVLGRESKRVLVQAIKEKDGATQTLGGMVLHAKEGGYTPEAEAVLRQVGPLLFAASA